MMRYRNMFPSPVLIRATNHTAPKTIFTSNPIRRNQIPSGHWLSSAYFVRYRGFRQSKDRSDVARNSIKLRLARKKRASEWVQAWGRGLVRGGLPGDRPAAGRF